MANYCAKNGKECEFANQNGNCTITACTKIAEFMKINKNNTVLLDTSLASIMTFEEGTCDTLLELTRYLTEKKNK